jgi:hypothetical protein
MKMASWGLRLDPTIFAAVLAAGVLAVRAYTQDVPASSVPSARSAPVNKYIDPALCAQCHAFIAGNFRKTGMARSFYRLTPQNLVEDLKSAKAFYHEASDSYFAMIERGGKYYQRRWQRGFDGKETNMEEKQIDFVLGSGNHARTYLILSSSHKPEYSPAVATGLVRGKRRLLGDESRLRPHGLSGLHPGNSLRVHVLP